VAGTIIKLENIISLVCICVAVILDVVMLFTIMLSPANVVKVIFAAVIAFAVIVFAYRDELLTANWLKRSKPILELTLQVLNVFVNATFAILAILIPVK
jgi:hypothetical protein